MPDALLSIIIVSFNTRDILRRCLISIVESPHHEVIGVSDDNDSDLGTPGTDLTPNPLSATERGLAPLPATGRGGGWGPSSSPLPVEDALGAGSAPPQTPLRCEVIVVDNSSSDGSAEMVKREFPSVKLILPGENLGFARATNLGLKASRGNLLMLLNPDTEVVGDALPLLAQFVQGNPQLAAASPALIFPDGRPQHGAFRFPTLWMSFFDFFPLNHRLINSRLNGRYRAPEDEGSFPIDHPLGAAMMIRREALDDIGLLDEAFFMYCEEVDWCIRAHGRGWQIYQVPKARIVHHVGQSTGQFKERMLVELHRSRYYLFQKHYSSRFLMVHRAITRLGLVKEWIRSLWLARRGAITEYELDRRQRAYRAIWSM